MAALFRSLVRDSLRGRGHSSHLFLALKTHTRTSEGSCGTSKDVLKLAVKYKSALFYIYI